MLIDTGSTFLLNSNKKGPFKDWKPMSTKILEGFNGSGGDVTFSFLEALRMGHQIGMGSFGMSRLSGVGIFGMELLRKLGVIVDPQNRVL